MPDDDARQEASERLAADLRSKREERGLSADDFQEKLNVPGSLLQAFEAGRLTGHPMFNRVYLRSFTRSYARAAGVPSAAAMAALDAALDGEYEKGQLQREIEAQEYPQPVTSGKPEEGEGPASEGSAVESEADAAGAEAAGAAEPAAAEQEAAKPEPDWTTQSPPGASMEEAERRQREKEERAHKREREREERAQTQQREREERAGRQRDAAARQREDGPARRRRRDRSSGVSSSWIVGALALLAVVVGGFFLIRSWGGGGGAATETAQTTATPADTAADGEQAAQQDQRPRANLQLGETMHFTVVAEGGPVRDLKVTRDQDVRRPYWIEEGQATVFPARQRIIIENPPEGQPVLNNIRLLAEGYPYPTNQRDAQGRIVITRQDMQAFADTLRGQPVQLSAQRDTASLFGAQGG